MPFQHRRARALIPFLVVLCTTPSHAHIALEYPVAMAASHYKATFKVGHACGESPIRQIVVQVPPGVRGARPMPKPGWALTLERGAAAEISRITWTARTPEDQLSNDVYDEFALQARLPAAAGTLYWPVSQVCVQGRIDWAERPSPGQNPSDLKAPAPVLEILPADGGAHHH